MDPLLLDGNAFRFEAVMKVRCCDGAEHLAAFASLDDECNMQVLDLFSHRAGHIKLFSLTFTASLLQRFDVLAIGTIDRKSVPARQKEISCVAGTDLDLIAFRAEIFDGIDKQHFCHCHNIFS